MKRNETIYIFYNKELNLVETSTYYELRTKYNLNAGNLSNLIKEKNKSVKNWRLFYFI